LLILVFVVSDIGLRDIRHALQCKKRFSFDLEVQLYVVVIPYDDAALTWSVVGCNFAIAHARTSHNSSFISLHSCRISKQVFEIPRPSGIDNPDLDAVIFHAYARGLAVCTHPI
jgi:hypothetical protein